MQITLVQNSAMEVKQVIWIKSSRLLAVSFKTENPNDKLEMKKFNFNERKINKAPFK